jgi:hypothetical protein
MKRPSFQFYPGDWLNDAALRTCSVAARGLWIEMLCLMHQGSDYGYLKVNHTPILPVNLARISGATLDETIRFLEELAAAGVYAQDDAGCIYSRRMIRDEEVRKKRANGGVLGGNPALKNIAIKVSGKVAGKVNLNANLQPTPSSSSSSSSSSSKEIHTSKTTPLTAAKQPELLPNLADCPHKALIDLFAQKLPTMAKPRAELWNGKSAENLKARWRWVLTAKREDGQRYAENERQALAWFAKFFDAVQASDFLTGRRGDFVCTLQWLVNAANFGKVVQGNYDNRGYGK